MKFVPRLTAPEKGNPYYNRTQSGGYAVGIIEGNPKDPGADVLANCVGYAAGRFNEIIGKGCFVYWGYAPDADKWIEAAHNQGLHTGREPKLGAVIVWGGRGKHVGIVEKINPDGSIITSESGYGSKNKFWTTTRKPGGNWGAGSNYTFLGFVYNPATEEPGAPLLQIGDRGDAVTEMQKALVRAGVLRSNEVDGIFGRITRGAVLEFQLENKLALDGICGAETWAALS